MQLPENRTTSKTRNIRRIDVVNRRAVFRAGLGAIAAGVTTSKIVSASSQARLRFPALATSTQSSATLTDQIAIFPIPDSRTASTGTEISFRGTVADSLSYPIVVGSRSGTHSGVMLPHADGKGVSFVPDAPFKSGEKVSVTSRLSGEDGTDLAFTFQTARPAPTAKIPAPRQSGGAEDAVQTFRSRPSLRPPKITVTTPATSTAPGYIFVAPRSAQKGQMILDDRGELIWFFSTADEAETITDFGVQQYRGEPVLTWWEGASTEGHGFGHFGIRDSAYHMVASIQVANGFTGGDIHEFRISPQDTALFGVYNAVYWDLSAIGGPDDGIVLDGIVQEIEIETGRVLFEWHSLDHLSLEESYIDLPPDANDAYDFLHLNSIGVDQNSNLVISARHTWAVYNLDRVSGEVLWRLNGKQSTFAMGEGTAFAYQHDARVHDDGSLSIFDNRADTPNSDEISRGIVLDLDMNAMSATLANEFIHPTNILSVSQGNMQLLPNGNSFIGWGSAPVFSEFDAAGNLRFNGRFPRGITSYRAYRFPWKGQPTSTPAIAAERVSESEVTIYASWNGATEISTWQILAGLTPEALQEVGSVERAGFETAIKVLSRERYFAVQAKDQSGNVLAVSSAIEASS